MNLYQHDLSMLNYDLNFTDAIDESYSLHRSSAAFLSCPSLYRYDEEDHSRNDRCGFSGTADESRNRPSPPKHRHDGSSPLPLGMDWSSPPLRLEGRDSVWPHDPQIGWSYCVTVPSWLLVQKSRVLDPVAFYRVQVGIQSPEGVTTVRVVLRRFKDFLNLFAELKMSFPKKNMSQAPPKKVLRIKSQELLEQRRCSLEDWMQNLLSDIDISRSLQVAMFLELEAAVRSSFNEVDVQGSDVNSTSDVGAGHSSIASDYGDEAPREISESGNTNPGVGSFTDLSTVNDTSEQDLINSLETSAKIGLTKPLRLDGTEFVPESKDSKRPTHPRRLSMESVGSDLSSANLSGASGVPANASSSVDLDFQFPRGLTVALPLDERHRLNRVLDTFQQRLMTAKTDMEDLIARLNQEAAARQFLTTKVKDLEVELETTTQSCKENMQQTVLTEKERITQMQWDVEDLRRKCMELELKLKSEEEERMHTESTKKSILDENKMLVDELYVAREQFDDLQKRHEDYELKSKTDVKLLVKEVKSLRNSQSELKHELGRLMKEKLEVERVLQKEKQRSEVADEANTKLLHECRILIRRLGECSVNFLVEEEDKLIVDTSLPSDAIDLLTTSDNRIGLLLAETQLLAQEIENACKVADESNTNGGESNKSDDELRKILTDTLVDNATLRMQVNSVILCALRTRAKAEGHSDEEDDDDEEEETSLRNTVLSKFFER